MLAIVSSPLRSLGAGLVLAILLLVVWGGAEGADTLGVLSIILRYLHVLGAMVWVGLIVFVNFIQLAAMEEGEESARAALLRWIVPGVAAAFRHASHLTVATGLLLLLATGYVFGSWVYAAGVYVAALRTTMLWLGAAGGLLMWGLVHFAIWPNLRIVLGGAADAADRAAARERVKTLARLNLILAPPVVFAMIVAAHGY